MKLVRYTADNKQEWDDFVVQSPNGSFLFERNYMEYHSDRFTDYSWLAYDNKNRLLFILPATIDFKELLVTTHAGLTYGGLITSPFAYYSDTECFFELFINQLKNDGINTFIYKAAPAIYHSIPSEGDLYLLHQRGAILRNRSLSSAIDCYSPIPFSKLRQRKYKKAISFNLIVSEAESDNEWKQFWEILTTLLKESHHILPVHTIKEIVYLKDCFPQNVRLNVVKKNNTIIAGAVSYISNQVHHIQYIASNKVGKSLGALDLLFYDLIKNFHDRKIHRFFDFGISTENGGTYLNSGLLFQKEGFGARPICYDIYTLKI